MIASLVANFLSLGGLLFLGWSVWMAVAIYWLENLFALPALAIRIRRAFPLLSDKELDEYLAGRQAAAAGFAARRFLAFYGVFALAHGLFVFVLGLFSSAIARDDPEPAPDLAVFDWPALAVAGLAILGAEILGLWLDRRPVMPDVGAYTRRMIVLHVTIVLGAFALTLFGGVALAVLFVALKTLADLGVGRRVSHLAGRSARPR